MSTYSDAWRDMDPNIRNFYRNWADLNTRHCWHVDYDPAIPEWWCFHTLDQDFLGFDGFDIAMINWNIQTVLFGFFKKDFVLLNIPLFSGTGLPEPQYDYLGVRTFGAQHTTIALWATNYPRARYRICKSYWTGAPRRRRNL